MPASHQSGTVREYPPLTFRTDCAELRLVDQSDGNGARPFFTLSDFILDRLSFPEFFDLHTLQFGMMEEQIIPFAFDEPKALIGYQLLNRTVWHF